VIGAEGLRYLLAQAAGQLVAFPLEAVREIIPPQAMTRLPGAGPWVLGLLNLRGLVLTVVDLTVRFGGDFLAGESPSIIVLEVEGRTFGVQVAMVSAVSNSRNGAEEPVDEARSAEGLVRGLVDVAGGTALVIDVTALQHAALAAV
jgi:chemotaxis signal transduction protein